MKPENKYIPLLFLFLLPFFAFGQHSSQGGQFEVDFVKGCAPFTVNVTSTPDPPVTNESIQYDYDYTEGDPDFTSATTHEYNEPGVYTILQIIGTSGMRRDSIKIEVFEPNPIDFSVYNCQNNTVAVEINDSYYDSYEIDYGDGAAITDETSHTYSSQGTYEVSVKGIFVNARNNCGKSIDSVTTVSILQPAKINTVEVLAIDSENGSIHLTYSLGPNTKYALEMQNNNTGTTQSIPLDNPASLTLDGLNTQENSYCFTLVTLDPCNNSRLRSETVCSIVLNVSAENRKNVLAWSPEFTNYTIIRGNQPLAAMGAGMEFTDKDVLCNQEYCYRVIGGATKSISGEVCVTAISDETPAAIDNITASIEGKNILLSWEEPPDFKVGHYIIKRSDDGKDYVLIDTVGDSNYTDSVLNTGRQKYCYRISYVDACNKVSKAGTTVCPMLLRGKQSTVNNGADIFWTKYKGWKNNVKEYVLEILDKSGGVKESFNRALNTSFTAAFDGQIQVKLYRVKAFSSDNPSLVSYSNTLRYVVPPLVFLPDAFTPNNDGLNDKFMAQGKYINQFSLLIFNRWGELIFQTESQDIGWDGKVNGKEASQGTYIFKYEMKDFAGQTFHKSGSFILLR